MKLADNNINIHFGVRYRREELQKDHCGAFCIRLR